MLCWIDHVWSSKECVCCACNSNERLSASFNMFCLCFCMSEVISSFRSLRAGSQVFALLMLFLCVILHTMSSGKRLQLLCIFSLGMLCLSAISTMFVTIPVRSVYVGGYGGLSESGLCVFCKLCPVCFLVVGKGPVGFVVVCSHVVC